MKARFTIAALLVLVAAAVAQQPNEYPSIWQEQQALDLNLSDYNGVIHGTVIDQDGKPAKGLRLTAWGPGNRPLGTRLPEAWTNQAGEYRFEHLELGSYTVCPEDFDAGYSVFTTVCYPPGHPTEVELAAEHPQAELRVYLPPKAAFLQVHLTNRRTGAVIPGIMVSYMLPENPAEKIGEVSQFSSKPVLLPPDKDLLIHVTYPGFKEWKESAGKGKPIRLAPGERLTLDVQLEPLN
jgi:hypothetical protein